LKAAWVAAALALSACAANPPINPGAPHAAPAALPQAPPAPTPPDPRILIVDAASAMIGQPYRFGGAAPGGFDCSGLVVYAAGGAGIYVPRTAREQLNFGAAVGRAELAPGDLVFMHLQHKELHVGIAIGGDRFIHAPSSGGRVRIDSLSAAPYSQGYLGARRIIVAHSSGG
jgi:cell wall-associated NlpC family hydrolase